VNLHGLNLRERAEALISIAHPQFRDELSNAFEQRFSPKFKVVRPDAVIESKPPQPGKSK
jgi:acyl-CoA hydrolase